MPKTLIPWNLTQIFLACNLLWDVITRQVYLAFYSYYCTKKYQNLRESEIIILNTITIKIMLYYIFFNIALN